MLTFKDLENAVKNNKVFINENSRECHPIFIGEKLVLYKSHGSEWTIAIELAMRQWSIKKKTKKAKLYQYAYKSDENGRWYIPDGLFSRDGEFLSIYEKKAVRFKRLDHTEIEVEVDHGND